jgi:hypothetical protein
VTEAILLFGWTPEEALNMPARRFFSLLSEGRKQTQRARAAEHVALCDVASIGLGDGKYYEEIRRVFLTRALGEEIAAKRALDPTDPKTAALVESLTMTASRLRQ